jgi:ADP-ribosylglycohydrolase
MDVFAKIIGPGIRQSIQITKLRCRKWKALEENSLDDAVRTAIHFGNDTDTTAAVACGLAGFGLE